MNDRLESFWLMVGGAIMVVVAAVREVWRWLVRKK